jgi:two-component system, OmpR family, sensor kinase
LRFQHRIALAFSAATTTTLVLTVAVMILMVQRDEIQALDVALLGQALVEAEHAVEGSAGLVLSSRRGNVPEEVRPVQPYLVAYGQDGRVLDQLPRTEDGAPLFGDLAAPEPLPVGGHPVSLQVDGQRLRGVVVQMRAPGHALLYALPSRAVDDDVRFLLRAGGVLLVAAIALSLLLARFLSGRLASDVDAIARVAQSVAAGDLTARVGGGVKGSAETRTLAAGLDEMVMHLEELVGTQARFISHAAHELRSPLSTLRGELQLALRRPRSAEEYRGTIERGLADVKDLVALSEDLLALARLESASEPPRAGTLAELLEEALRAASGPAKARGVHVRVAATSAQLAAREVPAVSQLARALRNLVDNAVRHSPAAGEVRVLPVERAGRIEIAVEDDGPGVRATERAHIFTPFFRGAGEAMEEEAGAGLGLSIARSAAKKLGGDVHLDAADGGGARFVLVLPAAGEA